MRTSSDWAQTIRSGWADRRPESEHLAHLVVVRDRVPNFLEHDHLAGVAAVSGFPSVERLHEIPAALGTPVVRIPVANHDGELNVTEVFAARLPGRRGGGRGVDCGESVRHLWADHKRTITAVRGPEDVDSVRVHVAEQHELPDQPFDQRADGVVIKAIPLVVGARSAM